MHQNKIIQYLDRVIANFCTWYLYRFHIEPMLPGYVLRKRFKRVAGTVENSNGKIADMKNGPTLYIDPNAPHLDHETFSRWLVLEHVKAMADPEKVETINIVFGHPVTK